MALVGGVGQVLLSAITAPYHSVKDIASGEWSERPFQTAVGLTPPIFTGPRLLLGAGSFAKGARAARGMGKVRRGLKSVEFDADKVLKIHQRSARQASQAQTLGKLSKAKPLVVGDWVSEGLGYIEGIPELPLEIIGEGSFHAAGVGMGYAGRKLGERVSGQQKLPEVDTSTPEKFLAAQWQPAVNIKGTPIGLDIDSDFGRAEYMRQSPKIPYYFDAEGNETP